MPTRKNIFVLGEDPFNQQHHLAPLSRAYDLNFHCLTYWTESRAEDRPVTETLADARQKLQRFDGSIDGLITFFDFPVSLIAPMLCAEFDLPSPTVEAVLKCEHKYWSRQLQREAAPEVVPSFSKLDPRDDPEAAWDRLAEEGMSPPFWIKPVKGVLGELAYKIQTKQDLIDAMGECREEGRYFAEPLNKLIDEAGVRLPEALSGEVGSRLFIVEKDVATPFSCTVEGHRFHGETHIHGIVDAFRYPERMAFHRLQYPSKLPEHVQQQMADASARIMERIGFEGGAFNIEYFWDPETDNVCLLEINPRISQSHAPQFHLVDGDANMKIISDMALGRKPQLVHNAGPYEIAAKFMLRVFVDDGIVTRTPGEADLEAVRERFPGTLIKPSVRLGQRLSDQFHVDKYSWQLAAIYMGGRNEEELITHYHEVVEMLDFRVEGESVQLPDVRELMLEIAQTE